jgi:hypothetical protein
MASQRHARWTGKYPPGGPAEWIADGHVTCNIQCSGGKCDRRMVDVRLDTLPQDQPLSVGASSASNAARQVLCTSYRTGMTESAGPCHSPSNGKRETQLLKLTTDRPYSDPDKAARRLLEHAHAFEPIQDGRIYIEKINGPFLFNDKAKPTEYSAGLKLAIERGWLEMHESGTFVTFAPAGAELFD